MLSNYPHEVLKRVYLHCSALVHASKLIAITFKLYDIKLSTQNTEQRVPALFFIGPYVKPHRYNFENI